MSGLNVTVQACLPDLEIPSMRNLSIAILGTFLLSLFGAEKADAGDYRSQPGTQVECGAPYLPGTATERCR